MQKKYQCPKCGQPCEPGACQNVKCPGEHQIVECETEGKDKWQRARCNSSTD